MERKSFALELKGQEGTFRARIATLGVVDKGGDVTLPGAFKAGQEVIVSSYDHASALKGSLPVGKGVIGADATKAWIDGQFFLDTTEGLNTYRTVKALGSLAEWSHGYIVISASTKAQDLRAYPGARRVIKKLDVVEVSPVLKGAGIRTGTESIKTTPTSDLSRSQMAELLAIKAKLDQAELARIGNEVELGMLKTKCEQTLERIEGVLAIDYAEVASHVDPALVGLAAQAIETASADLKISPPRVRWFTPESPMHWVYRKKYGVADWVSFKNARDILGATWPIRNDEIWIRADLTPGDLVETAAHETRHIAQGLSPDEGDAKEYGRAMRSRLGY